MRIWYDYDVKVTKIYVMGNFSAAQSKNIKQTNR